MVWLWRQVGAHLYRGEKLAAGVKIYLLGSRNEEKPNAVKNYGIVVGKVLEYTRESTTHEVAYRWADRPRGGTGRSHMVAPRGDFSHCSF